MTVFQFNLCGLFGMIRLTLLIILMTPMIASFSLVRSQCVICDGDNIRGKLGFVYSKEDICSGLQQWMEADDFLGKICIFFDHGFLHSAVNSNSLEIIFAGSDIKADDVIVRDLMYLHSTLPDPQISIVTDDKNLAERCTTHRLLHSNRDRKSLSSKIAKQAVRNAWFSSDVLVNKTTEASKVCIVKVDDFVIGLLGHLPIRHVTNKTLNGALYQKLGEFVKKEILVRYYSRQSSQQDHITTLKVLEEQILNLRCKYDETLRNLCNEQHTLDQTVVFESKCVDIELLTSKIVATGGDEVETTSCLSGSLYPYLKIFSAYTTENIDFIQLVTAVALEMAAAGERHPRVEDVWERVVLTELFRQRLMHYNGNLTLVAAEARHLRELASSSNRATLVGALKTMFLDVSSPASLAATILDRLAKLQRDSQRPSYVDYINTGLFRTIPITSTYADAILLLTRQKMCER